MEALKQKIQQWFIDNDVEEEMAHICSRETVIYCLWSKRYMIHAMEIEIGSAANFKDQKPDLFVVLTQVNHDKPFLNQTEENIFMLLNCLLNHIKS